MKTTYELMAPQVNVTNGPEGSSRLSLVEPPVTVATLLDRGAARALWRGLGRILDQSDQAQAHWALRELKHLAGELKDPKADLTNYRADMLDVIDAYMSLLETTLRKQSVD